MLNRMSLDSRWAVLVAGWCAACTTSTVGGKSHSGASGAGSGAVSASAGSSGFGAQSGGASGGAAGTAGALSSSGSGGTTDGPAPLGSRCTRKDDCATGNCVDGVCCDGPCQEVCEACSPAGRCEVVADDDACGTIACPEDTTCRNYPDTLEARCAARGSCKTSSSCAYSSAPSRTECATGSLCDGTGACEATSIKCGGTSCDASYQECCEGADKGTHECIAKGQPCRTSSQWSSDDSGVVVSCTTDSDCALGSVCCLTNGNGNLFINCQSGTSCPGESGIYVTRYPVCASPGGTKPCGKGTCRAEYDYMPATWKFCF
jgi:hypothetical protein